MAERGTTQEVNEIREIGSLEICIKNIVIVSLGNNSYGRVSLEGSMLHKIISIFCGGPYIITHYVSVSTIRKYSPIASLEQREQYQEDFCAEYDEYKDLHSRIATITHMFVQLGSKIKSLSPGTQEYKTMEDQILEKYNKYRKKFPGYREEKKRCEYLHEKLSYIKQLIMDYDVSKASS